VFWRIAEYCAAMSEENVEIVRRIYETVRNCLERGDPGAWFDLPTVAPDYEWVIGFSIEGQTVWRGREGYVDFVSAWTESFDEWSFEVEQLVDAGDDRVVALLQQRATGKGSGAQVEWSMGQIVFLEQGRAIRTVSYQEPSEALEAAGLSE